MGRRRPKGSPPPKPFEAAWAGIDTLERGVITRLTDVTWTPEHMVRWLYPDDMVDKLQAAFPHTRPIDQGSTMGVMLRLPVGTDGQAVPCTLVLGMKAMKILAPEPPAEPYNPARYAPIAASLKQAHAQHLQFEKVRKVVRWLNDYATIGAARHYCPWLTSVLPDTHEFQSASGLIYREPAVGMTDIIPVMRECGAIMAGALLAGDVDALPAVHVSVAFSGYREDNAYQSQIFPMI